MIQELIVYLFFAAAIGYLAFRFFIKKKKKKGGKDCDNC